MNPLHMAGSPMYLSGHTICGGEADREGASKGAKAEIMMVCSCAS